MRVGLVCFLFSVLICATAVAQDIDADSDSVEASVLIQKQRSASCDRWLGKDKFQHFFASALLAGTGYFVAREPFDRSGEASAFIGGGFAIGVGAGKELFDLKREKGRASIKDFVADLLGAGLTVLVISSF